MTIIDDLNTAIARKQRSDLELAAALETTVWEMDEDTTKADPTPCGIDLTPYYDKAAELLSDLWYCDRVWEAWHVGTMTQDDFIPADEDDDILTTTAQALYDFVQAQR